MPSSTTPPIRIALLGRFEVSRGEFTLRSAQWSRRKAAALLQRLALERRLLRDQAIEFLWPEGALSAGVNNLYRTLYDLRHTLDTGLGPGAAEATFSFEDGVLRLDDAVWVDAHEFDRLCTPAPDASPEQRITNLRQALALYQGDLLPDDLYAEWTLIPRQALRQRYREASLALAAQERDARDYASAIARLTPLLAHDPADEPVHRELMRCYTLAGRRHEALRQYQLCVAALAAQLDVTPEPETTALYAKILNGELSPPPTPVAPDALRWTPSAGIRPVMVEVERSAPLLERETELAALRAWLEAARRGQGRTVLIAGESGIGKTRLAVEALNSIASAARMTTLLGAAYEQEGQSPYQPFIEAFDRALAEHRRPLDENPITHFKRLGSGDLEQEHWALFNAVATFLSGLSRQAALVLLIDDLHAADEASLRLFHYLARQTRSAPVVLLATYRLDAASDVTTPFGALLNALYRERLSETLTLTPLPEQAVARILAQELGGEAAPARAAWHWPDPPDDDLAQTLGGEVAPELVKAVFEITEGNPFFVEEITHALLKSGQVEERAGAWRLRSDADVHVPAGLSGLLRERVTRLGPMVEAALTAAAVIGREFSFDLLRGVAALDDGDLLDALDAALSGHLLEERASVYRFRHPLIGRALYDALSRVRRARLHARAAEAIEAVFARRPGGLALHVEALAFHYDLSDRRDRALDYLIQAGEKAAGIYAFEVAVNYFERALALMDALGLADPARRWMILEALGGWHSILADTPRAVAYFEQALDLPPGEGWQAARRDRVRLHSGTAIALITAGNTEAAEAHLQAALADADEREDASEYADLLYNLAQLHWHKNEYQEAFDVAQRSLAIAERLNNPTAIARAFEMLALACHSLGEWQTGIGYEQQRAALAGVGLDVTDAFDVHL
jgi:predicted ATPase/DNA-binding SARP family transcriptional activator